MLRRKRLSANRKSMIAMSMFLAVFLLAVVGATIGILASQTQTVSSSISISYISKEVVGDMKLTAYSADGTVSQVLTHSNEVGIDDGYVNLGVDTVAVIDPLNNTLNTLTKANSYIVIECEFINRGDNTIRVTLDEEDITEAENIQTAYLFNGFNKLTTSQIANNNITDSVFYDQAVGGQTSAIYFYVKVGVDDLGRNASYNALQNWIFDGSDVTNASSLRTITLANGKASSVTALEGAMFTIQDVDQSNYIFDGYWTQENGGVQYVDENGTPTRVLDTSELTDNTLYARYTYALTVSNGTVSLKSGVDKTKLKSLDIPAGVTTIGNSAFSGCTGLTEVHIPSTVTKIGDNAFASCGALESVDGMESINSIGRWAFIGTRGLISIDFGENSQLTTIADYAFQGCAVRSVVIPKNVQKMDYAFYMSGIEEVSFEEGSQLTSIKGSFSNCSQLVSVSLPDSLTTIDTESFYGCQSLTTITIPTNVTTIGYRAFVDCFNLASIVLPDSLTTVGEKAFYECMKLASIVLPTGITSIGSGAFNRNYYGNHVNGRVYFKGTEGEWQSMGFGSTFDGWLTFYYYAATEPATSGNYWHYDTDGVTPIVWG